MPRGKAAAPLTETISGRFGLPPFPPENVKGFERVDSDFFN